MAVLNKKVTGIPAGAIYIGRGSKWGNPYVMFNEGMRDEVCEKHEQHLMGQVTKGEVSLEELAALDGKDLVCYCAPLRCHGHTLELAAKWAIKQLADKPVNETTTEITMTNELKEFKLIIAGGRDFNDIALLTSSINALVGEANLELITFSIVSGMAKGADILGYNQAVANGVLVHVFKPDWSGLGKRAGFLRNEDMGKFADGLIAFWDGKSSGTKHMIDYMRNLNKPVRVISYNQTTACAAVIV